MVPNSVNVGSGSCNVSEQNEQSKLHRFVTCKIIESGTVAASASSSIVAVPVTANWCPAVRACW
jgi:hypothetical protein